MPFLWCSPKYLLGFSIVFFILFIASLILIFKIFPDALNIEIDNDVLLKKNSSQYKRYFNLSSEKLKIYIFNVENPNRILLGEKPKIKELGPYIYKLQRNKTVGSVNIKDDFISYLQNDTIEFDSDASGNFSDSNMVTVPNVALISILEYAEDRKNTIRLSECIQKEFPNNPEYQSVFIGVSVKDLLFGGVNFCPRPRDHMENCFMENTLACNSLSTVPKRKIRYIDSCQDGSLNFTYFKYRNVQQIEAAVNRGMVTLEKLGKLEEINLRKFNNFWTNNNSTCDEIKGSDGTLFPPHLNKNHILAIYSTDICRYINLHYIKQENYKEINGYMFGGNDLTFTLNNKIDKKDCFCSEMTSAPNGKKSCFLDGVLDMQPCSGLPFLVSFPHFLWANDNYNNSIEGLFPNKDQHNTFILLEPNTGTVLQAVRRFQFNAVIRPIKDIKFIDNLTSAVIPLLWIEEEMLLNDEEIDEFVNNVYYKRLKMLEGIQFSLMAISLVLIVVFGGIFIRQHFFKKRHESNVAE